MVSLKDPESIIASKFLFMHIIALVIANENAAYLYHLSLD